MHAMKNKINEKTICEEIKSEKDSYRIFEVLCKKLWRGKINTMKEMVLHEFTKRADFPIIFNKKKAGNLPPHYSKLVIFFMFYKPVFRRWYFFPGFSHNAWDAHFLHICIGLNSLFMPTVYFSDGSLITILLLPKKKKTTTKKIPTNNNKEDNCYAEIHRQKQIQDTNCMDLTGERGSWQ